MLKEEPVWQEFREIGGRGLGGMYERWPVDKTGNLDFILCVRSYWRVLNRAGPYPDLCFEDSSDC